MQLAAETRKRLADGGDEHSKQTALLGTQLEARKPLICIAATGA